MDSEAITSFLDDSMNLYYKTQKNLIDMNKTIDTIIKNNDNWIVISNFLDNLHSLKSSLINSTS